MVMRYCPGGRVIFTVPCSTWKLGQLKARYLPCKDICSMWTISGRNDILSSRVSTPLLTNLKILRGIRLATMLPLLCDGDNSKRVTQLTAPPGTCGYWLPDASRRGPDSCGQASQRPHQRSAPSSRQRRTGPSVRGLHSQQSAC